jgi:hypothetical protein
MNIGDTVKVFSSTSEYDGQTGRIVYIGSAPGAPAPFVVQFGDTITEPFSERELVSLKPIERLWLSAPLETINAPHGASTRVQMYLGRIIARGFMRSARRRMMFPSISPCVQCGKNLCLHRSSRF